MDSTMGNGGATGMVVATTLGVGVNNSHGDGLDARSTGADCLVVRCMDGSPGTDDDDGRVVGEEVVGEAALKHLVPETCGDAAITFGSGRCALGSAMEDFVCVFRVVIVKPFGRLVSAEHVSDFNLIASIISCFSCTQDLKKNIGSEYLACRFSPSAENGVSFVKFGGA